MNTPANIRRLQEIVPDSPEQDIDAVLSTSANLEEAIEILVSRSTNVIDAHAVIFDSTASVVKKYQEEKFNPDVGSAVIHVSRENLWRDALTFYKRNMGDKQKLLSKLCVSFNGEDGIDAGALMVEFFTLLFNCAKENLFEPIEGKSWLLVPKRSGGNLQIFKIAGIIIAHSILQGGPFFNFLAPWVVDVLFNNNGTSGDIPLEHIPINSATGGMINFIKSLRRCDSNDEINELFASADGPAFEQIISTSDWEPSQSISVDNKNILIDMLLYEETVVRCGRKISAIREGLQFLGFDKHLTHDATKSMFLGSRKSIQSDEFLRLFEFGTCNDEPGKVQCRDWFNEYIKQAKQNTLVSLLRFSTGFEDTASFGDKLVFVEFLADEKLPKASACSTTLRLPMATVNKEEFFFMMDKALEFESVGFGDF